MEKGGSAVNAAVGVEDALGVTDSCGSGIGDGGTMMVYPPSRDPIVYDYRVKNGRKKNGFFVLYKKREKKSK
ncbi:gamma-glutamyltransferase [Pontibacillus litoralis]|uniref:Uncharacterized protein n=1 Tax=Pontibacillus litoralis JSM 072002 TaxID=1385512 RepID=A0A0A5G4W0_9BACI|nr:gamma-glutamyltransferase [Pontibacillus litoralis]KGX86115.1 hypothetical protein N784_06005 [Pontibacillus litoralis JSM 072002]